MDDSKKVCLLANGCPENRIDAALLEEFFKQNDWAVTRNFRDAELILFNACALHKYAEDMSIRMIEKLKAQKQPNSKLIVYGCLSKINKERLKDVYQGPTFGSDSYEIEDFSKPIGNKTKIQDMHANFLIPCTHDNGIVHTHIPNLKKIFNLMDVKERLAQRRLGILSEAINVFDPYTFCIKVCTGCLHNCLYCATKFSRGKIKSKPIDSIVKEFKEGLDKGYQEFGLLGTDLGPYGRDFGTDLVTLLKELIKERGNYKIKLRNVHPEFLIKMWPKLRGFFKTGKITFLGCAIESGSNRILKLMNRGYKIESVKEIIKDINSSFPEIMIRTQLMVGFPTETEKEFHDTMRLLDELIFDFAEAYKFEKRPNTRAAEMDGQVPPKIARIRYHKLFMKSLFNKRKRKKKWIKEYSAKEDREEL